MAYSVMLSVPDRVHPVDLKIPIFEIAIFFVIHGSWDLKDSL